MIFFRLRNSFIRGTLMHITRPIYNICGQMHLDALDLSGYSMGSSA